MGDEMTQLQLAALARTPIPADTVEEIYRTSRSILTRGVCASHERLRAEVVGLEAMRAEDEKRIARLVEFARAIAACTPDSDMAYASVLAKKTLREAGVEVPK